jgi:hypothetical protein
VLIIQPLGLVKNIKKCETIFKFCVGGSAFYLLVLLAEIEQLALYFYILNGILKLKFF